MGLQYPKNIVKMLNKIEHLLIRLRIKQRLNKSSVKLNPSEQQLEIYNDESFAESLIGYLGCTF